jgi:hypothetical protein
MDRTLERPLRVRERGVRRCLTCGKVHDLYAGAANFWGSWADPDDGHAYTPESWEDVARRYGFTEERERSQVST